MTIFNINDNYSFSMFFFFGDNEWCDDWKLYKSFLSENSDAKNIVHAAIKKSRCTVVSSPLAHKEFILVTCPTNESEGADFLQLIFLSWFSHQIKT